MSLRPFPQDAATLAAGEHPVLLGFAAEVGVNAYITVSLPSLDQVRQYLLVILDLYSSHVFLRQSGPLRP